MLWSSLRFRLLAPLTTVVLVVLMAACVNTRRGGSRNDDCVDGVGDGCPNFLNNDPDPNNDPNNDPSACSPACAADERCVEGVCQTSPRCQSNADCADPTPVCNPDTGACEAMATTGGDVGQVCSEEAPCSAGLSCAAVSDDLSLCFERCVEDGDCQDDFRDTCTAGGTDADGQPFSVCFGHSGVGGDCGFEGPRQGVCLGDQNPPLYCSARSGRCEAVVIVTTAGERCNLPGDSTEPVQFCDTGRSLLCDSTTGTCRQVSTAQEGEPCGGDDIVCGSGLSCVQFSESIQRCHEVCDTAAPNTCRVTGTRCLPLLGEGRGLCLDDTCTSDADCAHAGYRCQATTGGNICFPPPVSGPVPYGGICAKEDPARACNTDPAQGGDPSLVCLAGAGPDGFCSSNCTATDTCPNAPDANGDPVPASCIQIDQTGNKLCIFECDPNAPRCPTGLTCQTVGGSLTLCLP